MKAPHRFLHPSVLALLLCGLMVAPAQGQERARSIHIDGLGSIAFPNSGNEAAQMPFYRGVLLLHSFEFGPAREAFREAREADPAFAMAYWGEAMGHNYPLWRNRDLEEGRAVLASLGASPEERRGKAGTEREAMYLDAVETLYADGTKAEQDLAYLAAMERLLDAHPDDDEARAFLALAVLGSTNGEREFAVYMRGAATAAPVFRRNPEHPGAAHYLIHSFDDPVHAPLGLEAAEAYSEIAPGAAHAQHMTSHIFVALGMWERVVAANIRAMTVQDGALAASGRGPNTCGHYSSWRHYGHLMLGEWTEAETLMDACHASVLEGEGSWTYFASMRARHIIDSQDWSLSTRWEAEPPVRSTMGDNGSVDGGPGFNYMLTNALASLNRGDAAAAGSMVAMDWGTHPGRELQLNQLRGLLAMQDGQVEEGLALLQASAEAEAALPFEFGPPRIVKPAFELLGEQMALQGGDSAEAYRTAQSRTPGRPLASDPTGRETFGGSN